MEEVVVEEVQLANSDIDNLVDTQVATAKKYPRSLSRVIDNAISIVTLDPKIAATCIYSLPRGGKKITGPSVHLAKILAQAWGNMRIEAQVIGVDDKHVTSQAIAFDLENNLAIKVQVKRSIVDKEKKRFTDDMITVTGNAGNAIALRNAIMAVIPRQISDKIYKAAEDTIVGDVSSETKLQAKRTEIVSKLTDSLNVTEAEILGTLGKSSVQHITKEDLVALSGLNQAIKDGDTTVEEAFRTRKNARYENAAASSDGIKMGNIQKR